MRLTRRLAVDEAGATWLQHWAGRESSVRALLLRALGAGDAPDRAVGVLGHQERAVFGDGDADRAPPYGGVVDDESGGEILVSPVGTPSLMITRITLYPVRLLRFHEPCSAAKTLPRYSGGNCCPV